MSMHVEVWLRREDRMWNTKLHSTLAPADVEQRILRALAGSLIEPGNEAQEPPRLGAPLKPIEVLSIDKKEFAYHLKHGAQEFDEVYFSSAAAMAAVLGVSAQAIRGALHRAADKQATLRGVTFRYIEDAPD